MPEQITVRYWAGARRAAGRAEESLSVAAVSTAGELRAQLAARPELARLCEVVSFLVDGLAADDGTRLFAGAIVDVLPPFAGGA